MSVTLLPHLGVYFTILICLCGLRRWEQWCCYTRSHGHKDQYGWSNVSASSYYVTLTIQPPFSVRLSSAHACRCYQHNYCNPPAQPGDQKQNLCNYWYLITDISFPSWTRIPQESRIPNHLGKEEADQSCNTKPKCCACWHETWFPIPSQILLLIPLELSQNTWDEGD